MKNLSLFSLITICSATAFAQENTGFNPNSVHPVHTSDIMWKKGLVRTIDLREKQNRSFMSKNKEVTRIILDAVKEGKLKIYTSDSLDAGQTLPKEKFLENLKKPTESVELTEEEKEFAKNNSGGGGADPFGGTGDEGPKILEFQAQELYYVDITEDMMFDKNRSRLYYDILALTLKVPAEYSPKGVEQPLGTFKFKDLVEVFRKDPRAVWFNSLNDQEHRNFADAFELRLFSSYIVKVSNPDDLLLVDIYNESKKQGMMSSYWMAAQLMEYEHNLWEF